MTHPPQTMQREGFVTAVDYIIRERKTAKILGNLEDCGDKLTADQRQAINNQIRESVAVAGYAPFHKMVDSSHHHAESTSPVPWRFYVLEKSLCCVILDYIRQQAETSDNSKWIRTMQKKIPKLVAGADTLVLATWLPDPSTTGQPELTTNNIEHIAAASAAIQNLLLAAEARGFYTYWSSGGVLRDDEIFDLFGIPHTQKLLGAIFLASEEYTTVEPAVGANRDKRGTDWFTWLNSK